MPHTMRMPRFLVLSSSLWSFIHSVGSNLLQSSRTRRVQPSARFITRISTLCFFPSANPNLTIFSTSSSTNSESIILSFSEAPLLPQNSPTASEAGITCDSSVTEKSSKSSSETPKGSLRNKKSLALNGKPRFFTAAQMKIRIRSIVSPIRNDHHTASVSSNPKSARAGKTMNGKLTKKQNKSEITIRRIP